jgi:predicted nucleic acid-binding protein
LKAVFDGNIFVSALASLGGQAERAVDLVINGRVNLCISKEIIHEVLDVLAQKFSRGSEDLRNAGAERPLLQAPSGLVTQSWLSSGE